MQDFKRECEISNRQERKPVIKYSGSSLYQRNFDGYPRCGAKAPITLRLPRRPRGNGYSDGNARAPESS